ncbi:RNA polymerase sigma-D factor [Planctomycetes bacterium Pan216]|uniref:RNA polymerase sigma-D factor n=1 Tax=Kolteria novifilia TaxID=2527975 RepID=A0A518B2Q0_9BACT|nr:RNA polymerase sigma-D factor [Planctomycetes bacterium Pan216]
MVTQAHHELWEAYQADRSDENRNRLVEANLPLVHRIASRIHSAQPAVGQDDLFSAGAMGLMRAVELFDPSRGVRFSTYAYRCIWSHMMMAFDSIDWIPRHVRHACTGLPAVLPLNSIDSISDGETANVVDYRTAEAPTLDTREHVRHLLSVLTRTDRVIVTLHYLRGLTYREIGEQIGLCTAATQRRGAKALDHLRAMVQGRSEELAA